MEIKQYSIRHNILSTNHLRSKWEPLVLMNATYAISYKPPNNQCQENSVYQIFYDCHNVKEFLTIVRRKLSDVVDLKLDSVSRLVKQNHDLAVSNANDN